jgi:hypothetical protein
VYKRQGLIAAWLLGYPKFAERRYARFE